MTDEASLGYSVFTDDYQFAWTAEVVGNFQWQLIDIVADAGAPGAGTNVSFYLNGLSIGAGLTAVPNVVTRSSNLVGASNFRTSDGLDANGHLHARLGETMLLKRAVTPQERAQIEGYLMRKWRL